MKRIRIKNGYYGIVTQNGNYKKLIKQGVHFIGLFDKVSRFDMSKIYDITQDRIDIIKDERNMDFLKVISLKNNEIALVYERGLFTKVLTAGEYLYTNDLIDFKMVTANLNKIEIGEEIDKSLFKYPQMKYFIRTFEVKSYEEGLLFVDNKYQRKLKGGIYNFWVNPSTIEVKKIDLRNLQMEISGQEILTKDKAAIRLNFFIQYLIQDAEKAILETKDFEKQLYILIQLALREFVGTYTLDELLEKKDSISSFILQNLQVDSKKLGIKIINSGIRDIILTGEMKNIMNQVLIAQKKAQANVIMRREETASTRSLLNTAKLMENNEMLYKLKEMEYLDKIAENIGEITVSGGGKVLEQLKEIFSK